jgi:hypothetical protein
MTASIALPAAAIEGGLPAVPVSPDRLNSSLDPGPTLIDGPPVGGTTGGPDRFGR